MELSFLRSLFGKQYTARQASLLFLTTLLSAIFIRRFIFESNDPYKCHALMQEGTWYDDHTWLTPGCVREGYGADSTRACMKNKKISFIGDDSMQGLYWDLRRKLDKDSLYQPADHDSSVVDNGSEVEFIWDPSLNRSELFEYVQAFHSAEKHRPTILVIGSPRELAERGALDEYAEKLDSLLNLFKASKSFANPGFQDFDTHNGPGDLLLFAPVQEPFTPQDASGAPGYREMNNYLRQRAQARDLDVLWSFDRMTAGREDTYLDNNITPTSDIVSRRVDLLISLRCTARFSQARSFPNQRTCCGTWRHRNWIQTSFLALGLAILPATVALDYIRPVLSEQNRPVVRAFSAFTAAISLQYLADRTHVFAQVQRLQLVSTNLKIMIAIALIAGGVTIRKSTSPKKLVPGEKQPDQVFLPRDQTDEMKGWMQLAIIIYHYNMAWVADWYWEIIRVCVASYLFLTGFGHAVYFLRKGDYSFKRVVAVMLRTNLLPVALAYVMRTRWLLYYYMPLSSFWFLVVYATMAVGYKYNYRRTFVIAKILVSSFLVHTFINTSELPETFVRLFRLIFKMSFDANEFFHHRVYIDQYIVYVGMLTAMFYLWALDALGSDSPQSLAKRVFRQFFLPLKLLSVAFSAVGFAYFWYWVNTSLEGQGQWTSWQPYVTPIPILTFLIVRNAHSSTRNSFSFAFAWLGRYSGEMYVMQDHLWLAGDQEAVLRTGLFKGDETVLGDRWRDLVLITPLYLIACCVIGDSTGTITTWFTKEDAPQKAAPAVRTAGTSEVEMGLLNEKDGHDDEALPMRRHSRWRRRAGKLLPGTLWPRKVRNRAFVLLAFLWVLNLVSSIDEPPITDQSD